VAVLDVRIREGGLEARGVGPGVLAPAHAPPLADVEQNPDVDLAECSEERIRAESVHADRANPGHVTRSCHVAFRAAERGQLNDMFGMTLLRLVIGGLFFAHGTQRLFGWFDGNGPEGTGKVFESIGLRPGKRKAIAAGAAEAGGGALLAAGVATPAAGAALHGVMTAAIKQVHAEKGPWNPDGGWEYNAVLMAAVCAIVDARNGPVWTLASLVAGVGGALAMLEPASGPARPEPEPAEGVVEVAEQPEAAPARVSELPV
jgi:putative oxidoreductase